MIRSFLRTLSCVLVWAAVASKRSKLMSSIRGSDKNGTRSCRFRRHFCKPCRQSRVSACQLQFCSASRGPALADCPREPAHVACTCKAYSGVAKKAILCIHPLMYVPCNRTSMNTILALHMSCTLYSTSNAKLTHDCLSQSKHAVCSPR